MAQCGHTKSLTYKYHGKDENGKHHYQIVCQRCNYEGPSFRNANATKAETDCAGQLRVIKGVAAVKTYAGWGSNRRARRGRQAARASRAKAQGAGRGS